MPSIDLSQKIFVVNDTEIMFRYVYYIVGTLALMLAFNHFSYSFCRGLCNMIITNLVLRLFLGVGHKSDYRVARVLILILSLYVFIKEPFYFDSGVASKTQDDENMGDFFAAFGRLLPSLVLFSVGTTVIMFEKDHVYKSFYVTE